MSNVILNFLKTKTHNSSIEFSDFKGFTVYSVQIVQHLISSKLSFFKENIIENVTSFS